jgi:decaprenylphospho-beta-D-erythro-pentofuranosid-2-ulose 2-reductase
MSATARNVWILGGTSAIAQAYARRKAAQGCKILLAGLNADHLQANAADLAARGAVAATEVIDLAADVDRKAAVDKLIAQHGIPDEVLVAYGILGEQPRALADLAYAAEIVDVNFTSVSLWLLALLARRDAARPLTLAAIGSVAGDRGRGKNFIYGAAKGGLDLFLEGLAHANAGTPLHVLRIKPGFVDTPMTAAMKKGGPLWATPDRVAADIDRAIARRAAVVYTPWFWRWIMLIIRLLPRPLFNRLKI